MTKQHLYIIKFLQDNKVMKEIQLESPSISDATSLAVNMVEGSFYWNEIKVETIE